MLASIMPSSSRLSYKPQFAELSVMAPNDPFLTIIDRGWTDLPGSRIKLAAQGRNYFTFDAQNLQTYACLLHPNSLAADTIRAIIEARIIGADPVLDVRFGASAQLATTPSLPMALGDGWYRYEFTIVRPVSGEPMGDYLDMFEYSGRDIEVRLFEVHDLGVKGDVNLSGGVNMDDAAIVLGNYAQSGDLRIEDGDTNLDGVIDAQDVNAVLEAMEDD